MPTPELQATMRLGKTDRRFLGNLFGGRYGTITPAKTGELRHGGTMRNNKKEGFVISNLYWTIKGNFTFWNAEHDLSQLVEDLEAIQTAALFPKEGN